MKPIILFKIVLQALVDLLYAVIPRARPHRELLAGAKLVAHRGNSGASIHKENTLEAFEAALVAGAWGLEFDVRWTADDVPVISHDSTLKRVFGLDLDLEKTNFSELRKRAPQLPTLEEVIRAFAGRAHLMIEIKHRAGGFTRAQVESLRRHLSSLAPVDDYHLMALSPEVLRPFQFAPPAAKLGIAELNTERISQFVARENWGGLTGHYVLINALTRKFHEARGQAIGTGFICSRFAFYREINRGVEWIFTNHTARLSRILKKELKSDS